MFAIDRSPYSLGFGFGFVFRFFLIIVLLWSCGSWLCFFSVLVFWGGAKVILIATVSLSVQQ